MPKISTNKRDPKTGIFYREGTYDKEVIAEVKSCYKDLDLEMADNVLDIGANIGAFAVMASPVVNSIVCYEPEGDNYSLLEENTANLDNVLCVNKAVISYEADTVDFYLNGLKNKGAHSMHIKRGRQKITVQATRFADCLAEHKPTVVKMDIEGEEYNLLDKVILNKELKKLAVEFHFNTVENKARCYSVIHQLRKQGLLPTRELKLTDKLWHKVVVFKK